MSLAKNGPAADWQDIRRLRFAWVRGASIQMRHKERPESGWWDFDDPPREPSSFEYRIYPEDHHLQYGPLSSVLRAAVLHGEEGDDEVAHAASGYVRRAMLPYVPSFLSTSDVCSPEEHGMLLLFIAEMLADEGM